MNKIIEKIYQKLSLGPVLNELDRKLSLSELNSFLLELFRLKTERMEPSRILRQFSDNRFVRPAEVDTLSILQTELEWLRYAQAQQFQPLTLSPLAPLGACSAIGHVDQNNVISAVRGTEVMSDATNVLALKIAEDSKLRKHKNVVLRYSTVHRHVRGQALDHPKHTAHFAVFCLASGGLDPGHYAFELSQLNEHLTIIHTLLSRHFKKEDLFLRFYLKKDSADFKSKLMEYEAGIWNGIPHEFREDPGHKYYDLIQFKVFLTFDGQPLDLADGGLVDWTQGLLSNKKHRLFISGIGLELVHKLSKR